MKVNVKCPLVRIKYKKAVLSQKITARCAWLHNPTIRTWFAASSIMLMLKTAECPVQTNKLLQQRNHRYQTYPPHSAALWWITENTPYSRRLYLSSVWEDEATHKYITWYCSVVIGNWAKANPCGHVVFEMWEWKYKRVESLIKILCAPTRTKKSNPSHMLFCAF